MLVTDASESAWAGLLVRGNQILLAAWEQFPPELLGSASITRELSGLLSFFKQCLTAKLLTPKCRIQAQMDNMGAGFLVQKAKAKTPDTLSLMRELLDLQEATESYLAVDWRERSDPLISLVDRMSKISPSGNSLQDLINSAILVPQGPPRKELGTAEWALEKRLFLNLCHWAWGPGVLPEVDLFATEDNAQTARYCSRYYSPNSLGNAFSLSWSRTRLYAFPPFSQIADCLDKMAQSSRLSLLFVTKFDRAAPFCCSWP